MKILMILTSHDELGDTGEKTGFWLEELAAPYNVFKDAGADITLTSPKGGQPPLDPKSDQDDAQTEDTARFRANEEAMAKLASTVPLADIDASGFDAVFYPGGHGPLWDLAEDARSTAIIEETIADGRPVGAVCHAPAVLKNTKGTDGKPLVAGKRVTGFSNSEEEAVGLTDVVPFRVEDMLVERGGTYTRTDDWGAHAETDGLLVTGQNPGSSTAAAEALLALLSARA